MNVYEGSLKRIKYLFNTFNNVIVSFSGGKDSTVCLDLCYKYAKENNCLDKLALVHLDYEGEYHLTYEFVNEVFTKIYKDIKRKYWLCIPIHALCCCNMNQPYWIPWEKSKKDYWVREMPKYDFVINEDNKNFDIKDDEYEIPLGFFEKFVGKYGSTVNIIGIRVGESYDRRVMINSINGVIKKYDGKKWIVDKAQLNDYYTAYPIYDWDIKDIFIYFYKTGCKYNRLYDLFYQAGLTINQMRVASPFCNNAALSTLKLYKVIEPNTWGKLVSRVNGVSFAGLYGDTTLLGWKKITKPSHFTWKQYAYFLLETFPQKTKEHYLEKLNTSIKFWKEKGGVLEDETIEELNNSSFDKNKMEICSSNYSQKKAVKFDEYPDDIPEVNDFRCIPSYKRFCVCLLKNDWYLKYMGFGQTKEDKIKRRRAIDIYENK